MSEYHERRFPGESEAYRAARDRLLEAEIELRRKIEDVAALRRELPPGGEVKEDYVFREVDPETGGSRDVKLSELFDEGKDSLVVYGFMYGPDWDTPCPSCTSITDSANGIAPHVRARSNFVTVAKAPPEKLRALAAERGWRNVRFLSSADNSFNADYYAEWKGDYGDHHPMINVFVRRDGDIRHFWASELFFVPMDGGHPRHADLIWPLWNYFDMTPEGRGDFMPSLKY